MHEIFNQFFEPKRDEIFVINFRKLCFIERYLHKYTKLYINSLPKSDDKINLKKFAAFFYTLTVSSFYAYDCLPRKKSYATEEEKLKDRTGKGLTFITVDNLFNDDTSNYEKKIHFYTTKDRYEFFECFEIDWFNSYLNDFTITFSYSDENREIYNIKPTEILRNIFSTNEEYKRNIEIFKKENPESFLSRIQMTVPALFRFSVILSRIFLSQPIILSGDTGCGKTSALMLLFEYFKIPYNNKKYSLNVEVCNTLNCHGGVGADDVINHLKKAPKSSKKHIIFFDELNTSPASSFIEHLFLNGSHRLFNCKFVFIGALNPWKTKNPISYQLTKVGIPQLIINEEKELNLIERINDNETNQEMPEKKYDVHFLQQSTEDIIFDFNPISNERLSDCEVLHLNEEKYSFHLIIESMAKYPTDETRTRVLEDLKKSIDKCIKFIRKLMKERAIISYRDVERSMKIYNFLFEYYNKEDQRRAFEQLGIRPTDISTITVIISFVLRLPNHQIVSDEDLNKKDKFCSRSFKKVFDEYFGDDEYKHGQYENGVFILNIRDQLISLLSDNYHVYDTKKMFMIFVYQYTLDFLKVKSIWKFKSTFIHLFVMDVCIKCNLPCFVIGMPGTSKTFAVELLKDYYKDKMYLSTYMSSRVSSEDGIKSIYYDAIFKEIEDESKDNLNVVFIEEMGNANINPSHPLKILHGILDNGLVLNETGYCKTVPTIGVSSYAMDLAIMNRGVLVYTEFPDIYEILKVFEYDASQRAEDITDVSSFIERVKTLDIKHIKYIFQNLWPGIWPSEFGMPKNIALRSVYNIRFLIDKEEYDKLDAHNVCHILRELFNSKRLGDKESGKDLYKDLISQCPKNIVDIYNRTKGPIIDNMLCFLERIACSKTISKKSLSIFTKNYEAIEYLSLFDSGFLKFLRREYHNEIEFSARKFEEFKYYLFAENFKEKPDQISQFALEKITECIKSKDKNIIFVGNHPCFDSCLDLLNVPHSMDAIKEREVTLGSGFSSKFKLTNLKFYIIMIANISDYQNNDTHNNSFSYAFLDRTEAVYLDWDTIAPYYIRYKKGSKKETSIDTIIDNIQELLDNHMQYNAKGEDYLHIDIQSLFDHDNYKNANFGMDHQKLSDSDELLNNLIQERWKDGIRAVILTRSKIYEELYYPSKFNDVESRLIMNDSNIQSFEELQTLIDKKEDTKEKLIIIRCSKFDKLHFMHLKTFFDQMNKKRGIQYHFFIVYYGCDNKYFANLSTFRWPILSMDDISKHPELNYHMSCSEIAEMIEALNDMKEDIKIPGKDEGKCELLFKNIIKIIIGDTEKDFKENSEHKDLNFNENLRKSHFFREIVNFFKFIQQRIPSFNIPKENNSLVTSKKSQIISAVYDRFSKELVPFILFAFGSLTTFEMQNESVLLRYLVQCKHLIYPYARFLKQRFYTGDVFYFLFSGYIQFLCENQLTFNEEIKALKCISDRISFIIDSESHTNQLIQIFANFLQINDKRITHFVQHFNGDGFDLRSKVVSFQSYIDALRFRSFAGFHISDLNQVNYWTKFFICSLFHKKVKNIASRSEKTYISDTTIHEAIVAFRNRTIFDIFKSHIADGYDPIVKIIKHLTSSIDFNNDESYKIFKDFNKDPSSLKDESRLKFFNNKLSDDLVNSMFGFYVLNKWNTNSAYDIKAKLSEDKEITRDDYIGKHYKLIRGSYDFDKSKFADFANRWDTEYIGFKWDFKDELTCDCLIDEIQSICCKSSAVKPKFRKWLLSGNERGEPLSIIALRRYVKNPSDENKKDLAYVVDPFYGRIEFADLFIKFIEDQIPKKGDAFPFDKFLLDADKVMDNFDFRSIFKIYTEGQYYIIYLRKPSIAQIIWYHSAFINPKYPLITLLIKESSFFIDFHPVPLIINSLLHLRHIFSYNPALIPVVLHCTSLFRNDNKQLLFDLNCFDVSYNGHKVFEQIQSELDTLREVLDLKFKFAFSKVINKSFYEQIKFILQIYFQKYNEISKNINQIVNKSSRMPELKVYNLLPNMLMTNFSANEILTQIVYDFDIWEDISFANIEINLEKIFHHQCFDPLVNDEDEKASNNYYSISLFSVDYDFSERDFLGFTQRDYIDLYRTIIIQENGDKSVLSFNLYAGKDNKELDDIQKYKFEDNFADDNINNAHLNTYNDDNFYIKSLFGEQADSAQFNKFLKTAPAYFVDDVKYYQEGDLDKPNPNNDDQFREEEEDEN